MGCSVIFYNILCSDVLCCGRLGENVGKNGRETDAEEGVLVWGGDCFWAGDADFGGNDECDDGGFDGGVRLLDLFFGEQAYSVVLGMRTARAVFFCVGLFIDNQTFCVSLGRLSIIGFRRGVRAINNGWAVLYVRLGWSWTKN